MPILDGRSCFSPEIHRLMKSTGVAATAEIRHIESVRSETPNPSHPTRILALTGMSSLEDKRRAFEAGVDG
jgi:CheY-like chemotaxis protein